MINFKEKNIVKILLIFTLIAGINSMYKKEVLAIEKPKYVDMVRDKYGDKKSEKEIEEIAREEVATSEAYARSIKLNTINSDDVTNLGKMYGRYMSGYTGAVNYKRENFLAMARSFRDLKSQKNMQPLIAGKMSSNTYSYLGFNSKWDSFGMTSTDAMRWILYQFEIKKLLKVYKDVDLLVLDAINNANYKIVIDKERQLEEVIKLGDDKKIDKLDRGDILVSYDKYNDKTNYVGVYLGRDENNKAYALAFSKVAKVGDEYKNVVALSYINTMDIYPQYIDGEMNMISPTNYNYGIKLKFLTR